MQPSFSRRNFLAVGAAAAAGASFFDLPAILAAESGNRFGGFPVGIQSYTLRAFNLVEAVRHIEGLGLHYVEFFSAHLSPQATADKIAECKKLLEPTSIKISAHGVNGFSKDHEANKKLFEFAKAAGIRNLTADPTPDSFDSLDKLCAEYDVRIAIHNHGPGARYDHLEQVVKAVKDRHKNIGACVDTGHVIRSKEDPIKWIKELGPRVFGLHIKDDVKQDGGSQNVVIGKGHLDVAGVFRALKEIKFPADGAISLEYEASEKNPIADVKACLEVAQEAIQKAAG